MLAAHESDRSLTQAEYARHRGVSRQAVLKAVRAGRIRLTPEGRIDPAQADALWAANTDPIRGGPRTAGQARGLTLVREEPGAGTRTPADIHPMLPSLATSRAVREAYMARLARLDYEKRTGKLVDADRMRTAIFEVNRATRDRLLVIPDRLAATLAAIDVVAEVRRVLAEEIRVACEELSRAETM